MVPSASQTEDWPGRPEDLIRGALDGQADTMQRRSGYVMYLGIVYRGAPSVSVVAKGRRWKTTGRQPEPRDALLVWKEARGAELV